MASNLHTSGTFCAELEPCAPLDAVRSRRSPAWPSPTAKRLDIQRMVRVLALPGFNVAQCAVLSRWGRPAIRAAKRVVTVRMLDGPGWAYSMALAKLMHEIKQPELCLQYLHLSHRQLHRDRRFSRITDPSLKLSITHLD